ncbi:hypothetical protein C1645_732094 [Glomus cerebriforme]|uniref:Uncharacterized protein n=1 Tax=Glomus cerebriforme TaxID=658196 RepID=A0A397TKB8_9GLOM|nr:hypothetical protein C1645_732094 [Glomus cerebriforme]
MDESRGVIGNRKKVRNEVFKNVSHISEIQLKKCLCKSPSASKEQAYALIPHERIGRYISQVLILEELELEAEVNISIVYENIPEGETIRETAQRIVQDNLSERDVKAISKILVETASDPVVVSSHLFRLQREL